MKQNRLIRVVGTIDEESFKEFSEQLFELESISTKPVTVELRSGGGVAYDALAFVGRMRTSPCEIEIRAFGDVSSAAVLLLAAGAKRQMAAEAWVMVHEDFEKLSGNVEELERESRQLRRMEDQWAKLLEKYTGTLAAEWTKLHKATTYLTAQECLELGLVDELI